MRIKLTDRFVQAAKSDGTPQADFFDTDPKTAGLALRVSAGGRKVWTFTFTSPKDGKRARMGLGQYPAISLADARGRALEARALLEGDSPRDPRDLAREKADGAMTVKILAESYFAKHVRPNRRSAEETERRFARNVFPVIGEVKAADIHKRDINRVLDPVAARGSFTEAIRTFEDLRAMLRWAARRGDLDRNPMDGMVPPAKSQKRERVLTDDELRKFWNDLPTALARSKPCQMILRLCLVTGQRVGEVAGIERQELNLANAAWIIPAARSKNGHSHNVPLSTVAQTIIKEAIEQVGEDFKFLFPAENAKCALSSAAVARTVTRANIPEPGQPFGRFGIAHFTSHDLRRTAVSKMAELGVPPIVLGHVINHRSVTKAGITLSVYSQYDYAKEKREALELWARALETIIAGERKSADPTKVAAT